jgi:2-methylisocitrate lyase-like PEP mutase family enzyme
MTVDMARLKDLAERLRDLHHGDLLVLPNVWDPASATVVADDGFPAVATAGAAISAMLGYPDGEGCAVGGDVRRGRTCRAHRASSGHRGRRSRLRHAAA